MKTQITVGEADIRDILKHHFERLHKVLKVEAVLRPGSPPDGPHPGTPPSVDYVIEVESMSTGPQGATNKET